jgi:hypothetical protein
MDKENAINKIRGALAIAQKSNNRSEIETATRMVQNLLAKYQLDLNDISRKESTPVVTKYFFLNGKNKNRVYSKLANVICKYNFVSMYNTSSIIEDNGVKAVVAGIAFVGREVNVDTVMDLFHKIRFAMDKLSDREFKLSGSTEHGKAWKASFELGMVSGLAEAMQKEQAEFLKMKSEVSGNTGMALVISLDAENKDYLNNSGMKFVQNKTKSIIRNGDAYENGREHGKQMKTKEEMK